MDGVWVVRGGFYRSRTTRSGEVDRAVPLHRAVFTQEVALGGGFALSPGCC